MLKVAVSPFWTLVFEGWAVIEGVTIPPALALTAKTAKTKEITRFCNQRQLIGLLNSIFKTESSYCCAKSRHSLFKMRAVAVMELKLCQLKAIR